MRLNADLPLAQIALSHASASRVLHRHGLDFCCGGRRTLEEACGDRGADSAAILTELATASADPDGDSPDWSAAAPPELMDHLLANYHEDHRQELPRLIEMAAKVERAHGDKDGCPVGLAEFLTEFATSLEEHMQKEEQVLFPMFRQGRGPLAGMPVQCMEAEHDDHAKNLGRLRELTGEYAAPEHACNTWRALYLGLEEFELALMRHVHLENNVLFPRAMRGQ